MDLLIFYGMVSLLPLFFIYLIYRDVAEKRERRTQLVQFFRSLHPGHESLKDVERLVIDLDSIFPWIRLRAINKIVKNDSRGFGTIITALDLPYYVSWMNGYVVTQDDFADIFVNLIVNIHSLLVEALTKIGRSSIEKLDEALRHPNLNVRLSAISALGKSDHSSAVELLVPFLDSTNLEERIGAIVALGELRTKRVTAKIVSSLRDGHPVVREMGVRALMKINDPQALPALEYIARTDSTLIDDRPMQTLAELAEMAVAKIRNGNPGK